MESAGTLPHLMIVKKVAIHAKAARRGPAKRTILRHAVPRMSAPARATPISCNSPMSWCHDSMRYALLSLSASRITASEKTLRFDLDHFGACGTTDLCTGAVLPTTHPAPRSAAPPPPAALRARPHRSHAAARMARSRGFCFNTLGSRGATASHDHHADKAHADSVARALARHGTLDIVATCEGGEPCRLSEHCGGLLLKHWALSPPRPPAVALLPKPKITNIRVRGE
jgi:hypothetical protein